jgi:hypothetical protein
MLMDAGRPIYKFGFVLRMPESNLRLFATLPEGEIILSLRCDGGNVYAETSEALYEILADGSFISVKVAE